MTTPDWIFFDYGETLVHERRFDAMAGNRRLLEIASENPGGVTAGDVCTMADRINPIAYHLKDELDVEVYSPSLQRLIFETLRVKFDMSWEAVDEVFWDAAAPGTAMAHAEETLLYLADKGIKTAVISNMGFSSHALRRRLDRLIPGNSFEFIMTSSDYFFRKPSRMLFDAAIARSGAENAWYVGDNPRCDVQGAHDAGLFPVWIRRKDVCAPECPHVALEGVGGLRNLLDGCSKEGL
jgi:putative hydrolase of the HAD superfamily